MHGRIRAFPAAVVTVAFAATACGSTAGVVPRSAPVRTSHPVKVEFRQQRVLAAADTAFAKALWTKLATKDGNVVVSPASIAMALQMAYVGARGETAGEMARALHLGRTTAPDDVAAAAEGLLISLQNASTKDSFVSLADDVWLQRDFPVEPDFRTAMSDYFGSSFHLADFKDHGDEARDAINASIAAHTRDRIHDLIPQGFDLHETRLVLANAIYLKAAWAAPFEKSMTKPAAFTRANGSAVRPPTMSTTDHFDYAATRDYQAVRLPYAGNHLAMTLLLPAAGKPLTWPATHPAFESQTVDLTVPKFRFTWEDDLVDLLASLGMPTALTNDADFSGMSSQPLKIDAVRHKAFIDVNENGTEAAAATAVVMNVTGAFAPGRIAKLHFDRPFLFRIDDTATGMPLFLGKVADPTLGA